MATVTLVYNVATITSFTWGGVTYSSADGGFTFTSNTPVTLVGNLDGTIIPNTNNLTSFTLGEGVTGIGVQAFAYSNLLSSISFPASLTTINERAFLLCTGLTGVFTIPNTIVTIGPGVFNDTNFSGFVIGSSVTSIGGQALGSKLLATITVAGGTSFTAVSNVLYTTGLNILNCYPPKLTATSFTIPDATTQIGPYAFAGGDTLNNIFLQTIIIGTGLTTIGSRAFQGCSALTTFTNNSTVLTTFEDNCFGECGFTSFVIPNSVTTTDQYIFNSCTNLLNITIGSLFPLLATNTNLVHFGFGLSNLENFFVAGGTIYAASSGILYNFGSTTLLNLPPKNTTTNLVIPSTVTSIVNEACSNNTNLLSVTIPATVTSIGNAAFANDTSITTVIFADGSNPDFNGYAFRWLFFIN
jgi:hypothetical protein